MSFAPTSDWDESAALARAALPSNNPQWSWESHNDRAITSCLRTASTWQRAPQTLCNNKFRNGMALNQATGRQATCPLSNGLTTAACQSTVGKSISITSLILIVGRFNFTAAAAFILASVVYRKRSRLMRSLSLRQWKLSYEFACNFFLVVKVLEKNKLDLSLWLSMNVKIFRLILRRQISAE